MKKRLFFSILMSLSLQLVVSTSVLAFSDIKDSRSEQEILALKEKGIVNGVGQDQFLPEKTLTYAEAVQLLVKAFKLNINDLKFIKAPRTSDYYEQIKDDQWYSQAFIVAHLNGLTIPSDIKASSLLTKETFINMLFKAMAVQIKESQRTVSDLEWENIRKSFQVNILEPQQELSRGEAAKWVYKAMNDIADLSSLN